MLSDWKHEHKKINIDICEAVTIIDGTINDGDKEYNPHKIISQAKMRYQTL